MVSEEWKARYNAHLKSSKWKLIRKAKMDEAHRTCQKCGTTSKRLEVHHKTYERFGNEPLSDLLLLCGDCHAFEDKIRAIENSKKAVEKARSTRFNNGLSTFMEKKHGPNWEFRFSMEDAEDEFSDWLDRKRDDDDCEVYTPGT